MSNDLLGLFLSHKFYEKNRHLIALDFFENEAKKIWRSIELGHARYGRDLTPAEVEQVLFSEFRTMTTSQKQAMMMLTRTLSNDIGEDVAEDVLKDQFKVYFGRQLADLGIKMMDNKVNDLSKVNELLGKYEQNFMLDRGKYSRNVHRLNGLSGLVHPRMHCRRRCLLRRLGLQIGRVR